MSVEFIDRTSHPAKHTVLNTYGSLRPQIAYNSEGRISIRVPHGSPECDTLIVFDRPLSKALIKFIKNGVAEIPTSDSYCKKCATELSGEMPF